MVASAACGADLLALDEAGALAITCRIVLPFDPQHFRGTSVVDRPGEWGALYDRILGESGGNVLVLPFRKCEAEAYAAANTAILNEATAIARGLRDEVLALLVWSGTPNDETDSTAAFAEEARGRGIPVAEIATTATVSQKANS